MTGNRATRGRMILAMVLTYMVFAMLLNSVGTLILQSTRAFGVGKGAVSVLDAYKDLPIALVSFLVASLLPKLGYRRAMMLGLAIVGCACIAMPLVDAFWTVKVLLAATGAAFALVKVSVYSAIGLLTEDRQAHAGLTNVIEGWFMVGVLVGPWLFGLSIGMQTDPRDPAWLDVYWWLAAACLGAIALLASCELDESAAHDGGDGTRAFDMFRLLARPLVLVFLASAFLYVLVEQGINTWLPTFNNEILHLPTVTSVQLASLFAAATAVGRLGAGCALRALPWHVLLAACIVATGTLVLLALPMARGVATPVQPGWWNAPLVAFVFPLIGLFLAPIYPMINSAILSALPKNRHAAMTGLSVVFSAMGGSTGSYLTGRAFAHFGGETAFYLSLLPLGLLLVAILLMRRKVHGLSVS